MARICILDTTGHSEAANWLPTDPASIEAARQAFERIKADGFAAFAVNDGETVGVLQEFDPSVEEITFLPPFVGG